MIDILIINENVLYKSKTIAAICARISALCLLYTIGLSMIFLPSSPLPEILVAAAGSSGLRSGSTEVEIARFILFLDNRSLDTDVESAWENEIIDRLNAVEKGTAVGVDFKTALKEIGKRFES